MSRNQYSATGIKDFYLDVWNPIPITPDKNDRLISLPAKYNERPHLLAYDLYGDVRFWWVFAMRNKDVLLDPISDFKTGTSIIIPSPEIIKGL